MHRSFRVTALTFAFAFAFTGVAHASQVKADTRPHQQKRLTHVVKAGETLSGLAIYYGCTVADLQGLNGFQTEAVRQGMKLVVPWPDVRLRTAPRINVSIHRVIVGESLGNIASRYDSDVRSIRLFNRLHSDRITIGQRLQIPSAAPALKRVVYPTTVKPGDSIRTIAARHEMQHRQVKHFNPSTDWSALRIGQKVNVFRFDRVVPVVKKKTAARATGAAKHRAHPKPLRTPIAKTSTQGTKKKPGCTCTCHKPQAASAPSANPPSADDDFAYHDDK